MITKNGRLLAGELARYVGRTHAVDEICSLVARHSVTLRRITEMQCGDGIHSGEWVNANWERLERRYDSLVARLAVLVAKLPETEAGRIELLAGGDPRGFVVSLSVPTSNGPRMVGVE
jgi:hypothetical protein